MDEIMRVLNQVQAPKVKKASAKNSGKNIYGESRAEAAQRIEQGTPPPAVISPAVPAVQPAAPAVGMTEEQRLNELENAHRQAQRNYEEVQRYAGYATTVEQADEYKARQKAAEEELLKARDALRSNELRQSQLETLKAEQEKARRELEAAQTAAAWDVTGGESARQVDAARSRLNEISEQINAKELPAWEEKLAGSSLLQGLDQAGYKVAQTVDFLAGGLIDEGFNILRQTGASLGMDIDWSKPNAWERYLQRGAAGIQNTAQNIDEAAGENEAAQAVGKYAPMVVEAVPQAVLALMTAGTSSAAQGSTAAVQAAANMAQAGRAAQAVMPVINATADMAKDPAWLYSFANSAGASYADALADGATEEEAALYSLLSSSVSAMIETGGSSQMGGIDKLPKQIQEALARGERSPVLQWLKSIGSESAEEVLQGIGSNAARGVYDPNLEWWSATDENAVINPKRMLEEAKGGAIVSAILGGGQTAASVASNAINSAAASQNPEQNAAEEAEASPQQETAPTTPPSSTEASEALNTQESGDAVDRVLQMLQPGMSNNQARAIMESPELLAAFNSLRGEELSGSHSEQRAAIKNYANTLASGQAQSEAQAAPQSQATDTAQMLADMAAGRDTQQNAPSQQNIDSTVNSAYRENGAESAVKQYGQVPAITEEQFASLPEMEYEEAANYRDSLLVVPPTVPTETARPQSVAPAAQGETAEHSFTRNVEDSAYTEETLRADLEANREVYRVLGNKETLSKATAIYESGFVNAHNTLLGALHNAKNGAKLAPEMVPLSRMVANELARQGRIEEAHAIVSDVAAELTAAGQLGQAGAILKNEGPAAKAAAIKKVVEKLNNALTKRQKNANVKRGKGTKAGRITVDENLITAYANAQSETERDAVLDLITTQIAEQIPPTFMDRWNAWRYTAMLGNLKTQGRNIIGNAVFGVEAAAKRRVQALMELAAAKASGGKYQPTVSAFASRQLIKDARADFDNVADTIGGEAKYSESALIGKAIQDKRKLLPGFLEDYRQGTSLLMEWGDRIFLRFHYVDALSTYLQAHGVKSINEASPEMLEAAREFAVKEAQEATFRDRNAVSDFVTQLGKARPGPDGKINPVAKGFEIAAQGIAPFRRTPANVLVRGEEYSPLGVANTIVNAVRAKSGSTDAAAAINSAAKTVTGTGLFLAGWALAMAGLARGTEDDEELAEFQAMQGQQDWSVTVGDKQVSFAQFAPAALPFAIGIKMAELHQDGEGFSLDTAMELLGAVSDPMLEMSMLQGINDAFENITSYGSDTKALPALMINSLVSYLTQGLSPSVLRQTEQAFEKNRQTIYRDNSRTIDALIGDQQYAVGKLAAGIPGVDYHQQDYIDAWGRTQSNGNWLERNFNAIYNPTYIGEDRSTEVDAELERLYEATSGIDGVGNVLPQRPARSTEVDGERLSPEEFVEYSKAKGQKSLELVQAFMEGELYKGLNDEQRAASIKSLYGYAAETAKNAIRAARGEETEPDKYKRLKAEEIPEYIALVQSTNAAVSDRDYSGIDAMLEAAGGMSLNAQVMFEDSTGVGELLEAAEAGVGSEAYYAAKDAADEAAARLGRADANASNKLTGLATADISERERDALAEILLGKTAYGYYQRAIASGMTPRDTANLYMSIDADWDGSVERAEAYEYLTGKGISGKQAEDIWDLFGWNSDFAKYKPK